jgi:hypothetical protein
MRPMLRRLPTMTWILYKAVSTGYAPIQLCLFHISCHNQRLLIYFFTKKLHCISFYSFISPTYQNNFKYTVFPPSIFTRGFIIN